MNESISPSRRRHMIELLEMYSSHKIILDRLVYGLEGILASEEAHLLQDWTFEFQRLWGVLEDERAVAQEFNTPPSDISYIARCEAGVKQLLEFLNEV